MLDAFNKNEEDKQTNTIQSRSEVTPEGRGKNLNYNSIYLYMYIYVYIIDLINKYKRFILIAYTSTK